MGQGTFAMLQEQRALMNELLGEDFEASDLAGVTLPFTPPEYAQAVWDTWGDLYWPTLERELGPTLGMGPVEFATSPIARARNDRLLTDEEIQSLDEEFGISRSLTVALRNAFQAARGTAVEGPHGGPVLDPAANFTFWDNLDTAANMTTAAASLTTRWQRIRDTLNNASDVVENMADAVGRAAGAAAEVAGRTLGAGVGGFFGQLGIVGTAIVLGGGYAAFKVLT